MEVQRDVSISSLTTLGVGGCANELVSVAAEAELVETVRSVDAQQKSFFLLAGGSNVVVADAGFPGTVIHIKTTGITCEVENTHDVKLTVQAGEPWADLVQFCVEQGYAGLECLAGIPGSVGATPIQNVGAYGQEVADVIERVCVYDRHENQIVDIHARQCQFRYRNSIFRESARYVVLSVTFRLNLQQQSLYPVRYQQLADRLGLQVKEYASIEDVAQAVIALRRSKGMVVDPDDPASVSVGSFFKNPILRQDRLIDFQAKAAVVDTSSQPPMWSQEDRTTKLSAAWLIENAGFHRGYQYGSAGISPKHTLALINRGGAKAADIVALAREISQRVYATFAVDLEPEPVFVNHSW